MTVMLKIIVLFCTLSTAYSSNTTYIDLDKAPVEQRQSIKKKLYVDEAIRVPLYQTLKDVTDFFDHYNISYRIAFGTHLGAVRHQSAIPWDDDNDVIIHESDGGKLWNLQDPLKILGYAICENDIMGYHIYSLTPVHSPKLQKDIIPFVDIFTIKPEGDNYVLSLPKARAKFPRSAYPKTAVDNPELYRVGQLKLWGPSQAETIFPRMYGPDWATRAHVYNAHHQDIQKHYEWTLGKDDIYYEHPTGPLDNNMQDKFDFTKTNQAHWETVYSSAQNTTSSSFVFHVRWHCKFKTGKLLDIGCGTGQDTIAFHKYGLEAVGIDLSETAIKAAKKQKLTKRGMFIQGDATDKKTMSKYKDYDAFYSRFLLDDMTKEQQDNMMNFLSTVKVGARLFLEFRTDNDPMINESLKVMPIDFMSERKGVSRDIIAKTDHFRRFVDFETVKESLSRYGFQIDDSYEDNDLARQPSKNFAGYDYLDNPVVGRIAATKID